jgi:RNA polymerase sigma-70 factor (ECF subfamily)
MTSLITGSIDSAKDVVQETFVKLFSGKIKHQDGNFKTYITTIAYRLALKEKYRKQRVQNVENISIIDNLSSPIENQIKNENQKFIFNAITSLPKHQREILILRFYGEHSYEEIAKITELPLGTVKSRIFYAVKTCRSKLKEMGVFG